MEAETRIWCLVPAPSVCGAVGPPQPGRIRKEVWMNGRIGAIGDDIEGQLKVSALIFSTSARESWRRRVARAPSRAIYNGP